MNSCSVRIEGYTWSIKIMPVIKKMRIAMPSWETGRIKSGFGAKAGGLGSVLEELPEELVKAAAARNIKLEIEILTPCFAYYDRSRLQKDPHPVEVFLDGKKFDFSIFRREVDENISVVYFWDDWQLGWTTPVDLYPDDPDLGFKLYASVSQAMAGYIKNNPFHTVHSHDYHVGIIPFYLGKEYLRKVPHHLTIHNATYQGVFSSGTAGGAAQLDRIGLPGNELYDRYFNQNGYINFLKAASVLTHETGGKVTTVSGDLRASWGYAAELKLSHEDILKKAAELNGGGVVQDVFVPNCGLQVFRDAGIIGITNGLAPANRPENLPELTMSVLREQKKRNGGKPLFRNPDVEASMTKSDHSFDIERLPVKRELKRLLHLELFGSEPPENLVLFTAVGRLVSQKNFELIAAVAERTLASFPSAKFAILANPPEGDREAKLLKGVFEKLAGKYPESFFYSHVFSQPLSRLMLAGSDFALMPSRFEPCGLVDYEACALGTIVIGRSTGGLSKVSRCAYLYHWLDSGDKAGEAEAFFGSIKQAVDTLRENPGKHSELIRVAMSLDSGWEKSAVQYIDMYLFGIIYRSWQTKKDSILEQVDRYAEDLFIKYPFFPDYYSTTSEDILEKRMGLAAREKRDSSDLKKKRK